MNVAPPEKWSVFKLAHTKEQRARIMTCIQRLNTQEASAINDTWREWMRAKSAREVETEHAEEELFRLGV